MHMYITHKYLNNRFVFNRNSLYKYACVCELNTANKYIQQHTAIIHPRYPPRRMPGIAVPGTGTAGSTAGHWRMGWSRTPEVGSSLPRDRRTSSRRRSYWRRSWCGRRRVPGCPAARGSGPARSPPTAGCSPAIHTRVRTAQHAITFSLPVYVQSSGGCRGCRWPSGP